MTPKWISNGGIKLVALVKSAMRKCWDSYSAGVKTILYAVFITSAWSMAIWDVSGVVQDYRENNIVTQVKREPIINMDGAFLENVEACVNYQSSIFEKIWWNESSEVSKLVAKAYDSSDQMNLTRTVLQGLFGAWKDKENHILTKEQIIHVLKLLRIIRKMDICRHEKRYENYSCSERDYEVYWDDQDFGRMKDESIKFLKKVSPNNNWTWVSSFDRYKICHIIDIRQAITSDPDHPIAPFGLVTGEDETSMRNRSGSPQSVTLSFPMLYVTRSMSIQAHSLKISILITTRGLSDRTQINPNCFSPDSLPEIFLENCTNWVYLEAVKRYCGCYPYLFQATKFQNTNPHLPYCTTQTYSECMDNVRMNISQTQCENCLNALNNYDLDTSFTSSLLIPYKRHSFEMDFLVPDQYYYRYQDNFKATKQNVIAQAGGDIGFYTGFSIWALWKFIMFITSAFRQNRRSGSAEQNSSSICVAMHRSLLASLGYLREGDNQVKNKVLDLEKETFISARMQIMEEAVMLLVAKVEEMKMKKKKEEESSNMDMNNQTDETKDVILDMDKEKENTSINH